MSPTIEILVSIGLGALFLALLAGIVYVITRVVLWICEYFYSREIRKLNRFQRARARGIFR